MKILHITDSHATIKAPESRVDTYYVTFLKKLYELKYVIKKEHINLIIHTGDLFHSSKVSDRFTGQIAEIIKSFGIPMYVVPGNHDILGYSVDTLNQTKLGLLFKAGVVKELDRDHPIQLSSKKEGITINISGQEYYKDIDTGITADYLMQRSINEPEADLNILAIHGYLCDKPQNPNIPHTLCQNISTDADIILSGHFHESFTYKCQDFSAFNPGSMMRVERNTYNKSHKPMYGILTINGANNGDIEYDYSMYEFKVAKPSDEVFDYNLALEKKTALVSLENFKDSISDTNFNDVIDVGIENTIESIVNNLNDLNETEKTDLINKVLATYTDAYNNLESEENNIIQQGFIESNSTKTIKKVIIQNFQSHEYTEIEFKDGLNVIIGNSNSGKTSILRAIHWCIDNYPLGSDFIMTGKDKCSVGILFSDGTSIKRTRTRNDAGSYDVIGITPDGQPYTQQYRGFANDLPIEISDIHQMPKINLTKDISTHLNIMDQLDGPFLITESPANKASIIGRLTGTQYIDEAVKTANKRVAGLNKKIKDGTQLLIRKQTMIDEIDRIYNPLSKLYSYIHVVDVLISKNAHTIKGLLEFYQKLIDSKNNISAINLKIVNLNELYRFEEKSKAIILSIVEKKEIHEMFCKFNNINNLIEQSEKIIANLNTIKQIVNIATAISKRIQLGCSILDSLNKYNTIQNNLSKYKELNDIGKKVYFVFNFMSQNLNEKINIIQSFTGSYRAFCETNNLIESYNQIIKEKDNESLKVTQNIANLVKERQDKIQEVGVCPCCGQKLTAKKHIVNVTKFMKGS